MALLSGTISIEFKSKHHEHLPLQSLFVFTGSGAIDSDRLRRHDVWTEPGSPRPGGGFIDQPSGRFDDMTTRPFNHSSSHSASRTNHDGETVISFVLVFALLIALVFWPQTKQLIPGLADPPIVQSLGDVVETNYIGGLGTRTQVRTNDKTVLLIGAVELDKETAVERRTTPLSEQLCVSGTDKCHDISSR